MAHTKELLVKVRRGRCACLCAELDDPLARVEVRDAQRCHAQQEVTRHGRERLDLVVGHARDRAVERGTRHRRVHFSKKQTQCKGGSTQRSHFNELPLESPFGAANAWNLCCARRCDLSVADTLLTCHRAKRGATSLAEASGRKAA